jgi:hypothetical protein
MDSNRTAKVSEPPEARATPMRERRGESATAHEFDKDHGSEAEQAKRIAEQEEAVQPDR